MGSTQIPLDDLPHWFTQKAEARLKFLYADADTHGLMERLINKLKPYTHLSHAKKTLNADTIWNEEDVILITYGDTIQQPKETPLQTLYEFLTLHLHDSINSVHVLPYFPFSSDDGFAVIDYKTVDPELGEWEDIERISQNFHLMTDLVINHVSRENLWFIEFLSRQQPGSDYFIEMDADTDVSMVVRPRSTPVLVPAHSHEGLGDWQGPAKRPGPSWTAPPRGCRVRGR